MRLSDISVQRPVLAMVIATLIIAFGLLALNRLPLQEYPTVDQLTSVLEQADFKHPAHPHNERVTLSIGAVCFTAGDATFPSAYKAADKALYRVKSAGRNGWQITAAA